MDVFAQPVASFKTIPGRLADVRLDHAEPLPMGQHGEKAVLIPIEVDLLDHAPLHGARPAAQIAQPEAGHRAYRPMKHRPTQRFEPAAAPRPTTSDGDIAGGECIHEGGDVAAFNLVVTRQRHDDRAACLFESGHERGRLAERPGEADDGHRLAAALQFSQSCGDVRVTTVQHENEFIRQREFLQPGLVVPVESGNLGMPGADRHHH